ncbi:substrate-binding domain-containing protein [Paenibacillus sp. 19GGS1-52]|uniref:substrate-binding domain-containing protein n=1 Tax=Paenibacillus sp. 19GGS1-52 TaxID=2758563 RepID=UPI0031F30859
MGCCGGITYCKENNIRVPEDLAIVGFDNQPIAKVLHITTFEIPIVEMGRKLFLKAIDGSHSHEEIPIHLIERLTV